MSPVKKGSQVKKKATPQKKTGGAKTQKKTHGTKTQKKAGGAKVQMGKTTAHTLVQYILLPGDFFHEDDCPSNLAIIQACHARTAVLQLFKDDENVAKYTSDFDAMRTEVLEAEDEEEMTLISDELKTKNVDHILWMKSASNPATCIATKPYPKNKVHKHFKSLQKFQMTY